MQKYILLTLLVISVITSAIGASEITIYAQRSKLRIWNNAEDLPQVESPSSETPLPIGMWYRFPTSYYDSEIHLQFDFSTLPLNAQITSVEFSYNIHSIDVTPQYSNDVRLYKNSESLPAQPTYKDLSTTQWLSSDLLASETVPWNGQSGWRTFPNASKIEDLVRRWISETEENHGVVLTNTTYHFDSRINVSGARLVIQYEEPEDRVVDFEYGYNHAIACKNDGSVWTWGNDEAGQLGDGVTGMPNINPTPTKVNGLVNIVKVSAGYNFSMALDKNGTVWAWGSDAYGQLGDGIVAQPLINPIPKPIISGVVDIRTGTRHTIALKADGTLLTWGSDEYGQLGDGLVGVPLENPLPKLVNIDNVKSISAGAHNTFVIKNDGTVWVWGANKYGQLGLGFVSFAGEGSPYQLNLSDVVQISGTGNTTYAIRANGEFYSWGSDEYGQLGDGLFNNPEIQVSPLFIMNDVSLLYKSSKLSDHTIIQKNDGTQRAWGNNFYGNYGSGSSQPRATAIPQSTGVSGFIQLSNGFRVSGGIKEDGSLWTWGYDIEGLLGDGAIGNPDKNYTPNKILP